MSAHGWLWEDVPGLVCMPGPAPQLLPAPLEARGCARCLSPSKRNHRVVVCRRTRTAATIVLPCLVHFSIWPVETCGWRFVAFGQTKKAEKVQPYPMVLMCIKMASVSDSRSPVLRSTASCAAAPRSALGNPEARL